MARFGSRAGIIGIVIFVAIDVLLVAFALQSTKAPVEGAGTTIGTPVSTPSGGATTNAPPTTSKPRSATTTTTADPGSVAVAPLTVGVVAIDGRTAVRFTVGTCAQGGSHVELTRNGGGSWGPRSAPFDAVTRIRVRSDGSTFAVGANGSSGCTPGMRQASSIDSDWGSRSSASGAWYRDPRDNTRIGLRTGGTGKPCGSAPVIDLSVVDSGAAVLCDNGTVRTSTSGTTWTDAGTVRGALAVALGSQGRTYAAVPGLAGCSGIAVVDVSAPATALGCAAADLSKVAPGTVALSASPHGGWLLVGDQVYRAGGDLSTWKSS